MRECSVLRQGELHRRLPWILRAGRRCRHDCVQRPQVLEILVLRPLGVDAFRVLQAWARLVILAVVLQSSPKKRPLIGIATTHAINRNHYRNADSDRKRKGSYCVCYGITVPMSTADTVYCDFSMCSSGYALIDNANRDEQARQK